MRKSLEKTLHKRLFHTREIQGLYGHAEALLYFWDLKVKVALAKFSRSQPEEMTNEI